MQAYPLAVHLNGIAVDHRGDAGHVRQHVAGKILDPFVMQA